MIICFTMFSLLIKIRCSTQKKRSHKGAIISFFDMQLHYLITKNELKKHVELVYRDF